MPRKKEAENTEQTVQTESAPELVPAEQPVRSSADTLRQFYALDFHELDRELKEDEREEWNSIYASYRGRSALSGKIIGVDHLVNHDGSGSVQELYCATIIPHRVRIVIPSTEMWLDNFIPPDFVFRGTVGAKIDFVITRVEREAGFAVASRREAIRAKRYYFAHHRELANEGSMTKCQVLSVGPRRCTVECHGYDLNLTQRDLSYTAIADLRAVYHPGDELSCVIKGFDAEKATLSISVKEARSNPYDGARLRHPVSSRRQAIIAGKYGGGVFCNLPDGTVCMCNYSYQYADTDFKIGDIVILRVTRFDDEKKQMYGKILSKW